MNYSDKLSFTVSGEDLGLILAAEFVSGAVVSPDSLTRQAFMFLGLMLIAICTVSILFFTYTDVW